MLVSPTLLRRLIVPAIVFATAAHPASLAAQTAADTADQTTAISAAASAIRTWGCRRNDLDTAGGGACAIVT